MVTPFDRRLGADLGVTRGALDGSAARTAPCNVERINRLGEDYDEYPFQVPAQGAASGQRTINWDTRMVNSANNQLVGSKLNTPSRIERFWVGDHFSVQVAR